MTMLKSLSVVLTMVFAACSGARDALTIQESPACPTVVEGFLHSKIGFNGKVPILMLHYDFQKKQIWHGEIVAVTDSGIVFDPQRDGPLYDPPAKFYPYAAIQCAIDSFATVIYGTIPEKYSIVWDMELQIKKRDSLEALPIRMNLQSNKPFAYCLDPGIYKITALTFKSSTQYIDNGVEYPDLTFEVRPNVSNYLGDLFLDFATRPSPDVALMQATPAYRPGYGMASSYFGLLGAVIESLGRPGMQVHSLSVQRDSAYRPQSSLSVIYSGLRFAVNPDTSAQLVK
jgi:hypothetical protein